MRSGKRLLTLALCVLAAGASSGCLADDFFPEPFQWRAVHSHSEEFQGAHYRGDTSFAPPARADRMRVAIAVALDERTPRDPLGALAGDVTPGLNVTVALPDGRVVTHRFDASGEVLDLVPAAPAGEVEVTAAGRGQGSWSVAVEAYAPKYPDYQWWQAWRWGEGGDAP